MTFKCYLCFKSLNAIIAHCIQTYLHIAWSNWVKINLCQTGCNYFCPNLTTTTSPPDLFKIWERNQSLTLVQVIWSAFLVSISVLSRSNRIAEIRARGVLCLPSIFSRFLGDVDNWRKFANNDTLKNLFCEKVWGWGRRALAMIVVSGCGLRGAATLATASKLRLFVYKLCVGPRTELKWGNQTQNPDFYACASYPRGASNGWPNVPWHTTFKPFQIAFINIIKTNWYWRGLKFHKNFKLLKIFKTFIFLNIYFEKSLEWNGMIRTNF